MALQAAAHAFRSEHSGQPPLLPFVTIPPSRHPCQGELLLRPLSNKCGVQLTPRKSRGHSSKREGLAGRRSRVPTRCSTREPFRQPSASGPRLGIAPKPRRRGASGDAGVLDRARTKACSPPSPAGLRPRFRKDHAVGPLDLAPSQQDDGFSQTIVIATHRRGSGRTGADPEVGDRDFLGHWPRFPLGYSTDPATGQFDLESRRVSSCASEASSSG
jgi:hypothetical protein